MKREDGDAIRGGGLVVAVAIRAMLSSTSAAVLSSVERT